MTWHGHVLVYKLEITLFGNGMISSQRSLNAHRVSSANDDATVHLQQIHSSLNIQRIINRSKPNSKPQARVYAKLPIRA